ncbi:MAG: ferritin-like domain-containing protein [Sandaracinus sp.]|nr:ferritin-like domain-containing protein [Myxococcales bacterium]MCB9613254.1 ferritin-like domain-containing protein [Sandaracinus sp.]
MAQSPRFEPLGFGPFAKTHAAFTEVDAFDWNALASGEHDPKERERGRRSFVLRALDEQRSLAAFTELLGELVEVGAPIDVIGSLARVVRDEALHVDLCDRVVKALGGWDDKAPEPTWVRSDKRLPLQQRVLATVLGSLCIGETISVHMIAGVRKGASDPVVHEVLTRLLADESFHSRFGWWWLESMPLTDDDHAFARRYLAKLLPSVARQMAPMTASKKVAPSPFGSLGGDERRDAFETAMHKTILPGFDAAGLDASALWKRLQEPASA